MNSVSSPPQFEYIIIGGGTAGFAIVSHPSEDAATSVLLIEAGSNRISYGFCIGHVPIQ